MPARIDPRDHAARPRRLGRLSIALMVALISPGCGGEPSEREVNNARAFEALLTAVSLRNAKEVEADAHLIDQRHGSGELSDGNYKELRAIVEQARARDWQGAEKRAYAFRAQFGDRGSYFK